MTQHAVRLGTVQETLLIPLYGRAVESRKQDPALRDPRAEEITAAVDYDFSRFDGLPSLLGSVLRTLLFDHWVEEYLREHPDGTVVEIGTGLNTRFERVDNGRVRWFDLDLPDVVELRRAFFTDTPRRTTVAVSATDPSWADTVAAAGVEGPCFFSAEAVLPYLEAPLARQVVDLIAARFPGSRLALDTAGPAMFDTQDEHDALSRVQARMAWRCPDPAAELAAWQPRSALLASHTLTTLPAPLHDQLPAAHREMVAHLAAQRMPRVDDYRLNLFRLD